MGFQVSYLLILACVLNGCSSVIIINEEIIYALAGSSVTLKCSILQGKETHVTQIQWSKSADGLSRIIAVYNPLYGTKYSEAAYNNSASFEKCFHDCSTDFSRTSNEVDSTANNLECNHWVLQLKNVSFEHSGSYECIFTTFPIGTSNSKTQLIVKKRDYKTPVLPALLNQTLEIPCVNSVPRYINLTNASVTWLLQKENGNETILIKKQSYYLQGYTTYLTVYKDRIQMSSKNALLISPLTVIDDDKKFVCSIATLCGKIQEKATQVKIYAKPEISIVFHTDSKGKASITCVIKKAYPKPKLMWYMGGKILNAKSDGLLIENKGIKHVGSFYEMTSFLSIWNRTHPYINQGFKCMSAYHIIRNDKWNFSSKEIFIPHGFQNTSLAYSDFISHVTAVSDSPTERLQTVLSEVTEVTLVPDSSSEKHLHSIKALQSDTTTKLFSDSIVPHKSLHSTQSRQNDTITMLFSESTVPQNSTIVPKHSYFPWPAVVAFLLLFCTFLIICGIRKWCQHQRKIMNKPPSFKPPPPPVKYSSIQVYNEIYSSSEELENLKSV